MSSICSCGEVACMKQWTRMETFPLASTLLAWFMSCRCVCLGFQTKGWQFTYNSFMKTACLQTSFGNETKKHTCMLVQHPTAVPCGEIEKQEGNVCFHVQWNLDCCVSFSVWVNVSLCVRSHFALRQCIPKQMHLSETISQHVCVCPYMWGIRGKRRSGMKVQRLPK